MAKIMVNLFTFLLCLLSLICVGLGIYLSFFVEPVRDNTGALFVVGAVLGWLGLNLLAAISIDKSK